MTVAVYHRELERDASPIDRLAIAHVTLLMLSAEVKNVALRALIRVAAKLAEIEGHDATANVYATLARKHAEKAVRIPTSARRRP